LTAQPEDARTLRRKRRRNLRILASFFLFPVVLLAGLFLFRQSGAKRAVADQAIYAAKTSPELAARIGLPMEAGWPIRGYLTSGKSYGSAHLEISLSGPRGRGVLLERARRDGGPWRLCSVLFRSDGQRDLILIDDAKQKCDAD
jgi:hypothetical protein